MEFIVHNGSFSKIGKTYNVISPWIEKNSYKISGAVREIYHKGKWAANNPQEYITELQFPLIYFITSFIEDLITKIKKYLCWHR
ncbi:hypothetical protein HMPREF1982_01224 [Clostridiales bacterium oral taxon 876 str. F0540]|nr:hypothetical protein HMPREF1982_01224 [Clostridiales bacterium oral taxon 876 str. F0540]